MIHYHHNSTNPSRLVDYDSHNRTPSRILKDYSYFVEFSIKGPKAGPGTWHIVSEGKINGFQIKARTRQIAYIKAAAVVHNCSCPLVSDF